jgi:hypothetical protein
MTWAWLSLLLAAAPIIALWLRSPPPRAVRVSSLLLARALARANARRARPPLAALVELALVLGALGLCAVALARHAGADASALRLLRVEGGPRSAPEIVGDLSLVDLQVEPGLVQRADGQVAVEAALQRPDEPMAAGATTTASSPAGAPPSAWDPVQAALHEERALAALRAQCAAAPGTPWAALDPTAAAMLRAASCLQASGAAPRDAPPLRLSARRTDALGALELAVSGSTEDPPTLRLDEGPTLPVPLSAAGASAVGWAQLRWDQAAPAVIHLEGGGSDAAALPAPPPRRVRVGLWTTAPAGALARALRAHPAVELELLGPGAPVPAAVELALLAAAPPVPLPPNIAVIAALGVDPAPISATWAPMAPTTPRVQPRLGAPHALTRFTTAVAEEGALIDGLDGGTLRALRLPAGASALWTGPGGPTLGVWDEAGQTRVALGLDPERAVRAGQLPVLHLLANLVELAGGAPPVARLSPTRAGWFSPPSGGAASLLPPSSEAAPAPLLWAAAAALTLQAALRRALRSRGRP